MKMKFWYFCMIIVFAFALSACGKSGDQLSGGKNEDTQGGENAKPPTPYTMTIYGGGVSVEEFDDRFRDTLENKFSHITFRYLKRETGITMTDLVSQREIPDIIRTDIPTLISDYLDLGLGFDLREHAKKHNYDLARFNQVFIDEVVDAGQTEELYGLPVPPYFPMVLYYNKDLFNKFGADFPTDGMSWDDVYDLAQRMTREDGGMIYRGYSMNPMSVLRDNVFSLPILDPEKDQLADPDKWATLFNNLKRFYDIPNNQIERSVSLENQAFSKGNVAMQVNAHNVYLNIPPEVDWDIVAYPTLPGAPALMPQRASAYWSIANTSEHKDEAFLVIMEMLSDDVQRADSGKGIPTTLVNKEIQQALGKDHPIYSTKNMNAVNYYSPIPYTEKRKPGLVDVPGSIQQNTMGQTFIDVAMGNLDVNTALREFDEVLKMNIEKEKNK